MINEGMETLGSAEAAQAGAIERENRVQAASSRLGELVLEGLSRAKGVGEIVAGFYYFLSPVPKEFKMTDFKTMLEPIIQLPRRET